MIRACEQMQANTHTHPLYTAHPGCLYVYMLSATHTATHKCAHTHTHSHTHSHTHTPGAQADEHIGAHTHTCTGTRTRTHTYTHKPGARANEHDRLAVTYAPVCLGAALLVLRSTLVRQHTAVSVVPKVAAHCYRL